jgi:hypothetical protein
LEKAFYTQNPPVPCEDSRANVYYVREAQSGKEEEIQDVNEPA